MATKLKEPTKETDEKAKTFLPMPFWSQIVNTLDSKAQSVSEVYGYGKIDMSLIVFNGKVKDVIFNDEVRIRPDWSKPPLSES